MLSDDKIISYVPKEVIPIIYKSSEHYLTYLDTLGSHLGLESIFELLDRLGNPEETLKCIHIAGTNGKGSVASYLTSILMEANNIVGTFTSPEITTIRETICINTSFISPYDLDSYLQTIKVHCENMLKEGLSHPTRFEVLVALAFFYFQDKGCTVVVLETGMGGRLDATNVLRGPLCCAITSIGLDHMAYLGDTLEAIAYEKSGIIKPLSPVVLYPAADSVRTVFEQVCNQNDAPLTVLDLDKLKLISHDLSGQTFSYKDYLNIKIKLLGEHQIRNAALAVEVIQVLQQKGLKISTDALYKGFAKATWPGRFEKVHDEPLFFIDGAHNVQGATALRETISAYCKNKKIIFIMGLLQDKDYAAISKLTAPLASHVFLVRPSNPRALDPRVLEVEVKKYCTHTTLCDCVASATHLALKHSTSEDVIIAFGSLYFIGEIPALLKNL